MIDPEEPWLLPPFTLSGLHGRMDLKAWEGTEHSLLSLSLSAPGQGYRHRDKSLLRRQKLHITETRCASIIPVSLRSLWSMLLFWAIYCRQSSPFSCGLWLSLLVVYLWSLKQWAGISEGWTGGRTLGRRIIYICMYMCQVWCRFILLRKAVILGFLSVTVLLCDPFCF